jgi:hypothetical protein
MLTTRIRNVHISKPRWSPSRANQVLSDDPGCSAQPLRRPVHETATSIIATPRTEGDGHREQDTLDIQTTASGPSSTGWERFVEDIGYRDGVATLRCLWTTKEDGCSNVCTYTAKKQLVKRHVETTHLKLK